MYFHITVVICFIKLTEKLMPLTLTVTEGVLPKGQEKAAFARLSDAMLKWHGLTGNKAMTPNVIGSINVLSKGHTFSGSKEAQVAFVEWKVPAFAFATREIQIGYIDEATSGDRRLTTRRTAATDIRRPRSVTRTTCARAPVARAGRSPLFARRGQK